MIANTSASLLAAMATAAKVARILIPNNFRSPKPAFLSAAGSLTRPLRALCRIPCLCFSEALSLPLVDLAARQMKQPLTHVALARRYFEWCKHQVDLAERARSPKARDDHLELAEFYFKLADRELVENQQHQLCERPPDKSGSSNQPSNQNQRNY